MEVHIMKTKTKIGVVSMVSLNLSSMVVGNAIAAISQSFKGVPISTIQLHPKMIVRCPRFNYSQLYLP